MKKVLCVVALFLVVLISLGQSRENRPKIAFQKMSGTLNGAKGWAYNETLGEWIEYPNFISSDKKNKEFPLLYGGYVESRADHNFVSMVTKTVTVGEKTYFVILVDKFDGGYKYPSLKKDWLFWKTTYAYIFTEEEYSKLRQLNSQIELTTKKNADCVRTLGCDESELLAKIQKAIIDVDEEWAVEYTFPIKKTTDNGKSIVRFYEPAFHAEYDFDKGYFEVPEEEFKKLIL